MSWPSVPHFNQHEKKSEPLPIASAASPLVHPSPSNSLSGSLATSTPSNPNSKDGFLKFLRRVNLDEYADWFLHPAINFSTEKDIRDGVAMMQRHPEMLQQAAKSYALPDDLDLRYLKSRLIETHSYSVMIISPDGSPKRDAAIMQDAKKLQELFVRQSVFGYRPEDVFLVVAKTAKEITSELKKLAILTELNEANNFVFYYSGHGVGQALLCQDGSQVKSADLSKLLQDIRAKSKLAILDCCFAGSIVDPVISTVPSTAHSDVRGRSDSSSLQLDLQSRGMAVLGSSNRNQTSAWFDGLTSFLICALEGAPVCPLTNSKVCGAHDQCSFFRTKACQLEKGYICIFDLFQYLKKHANEFLIDGQKYVHPYLKYEGEDNFRICAFAGRPVEQEELDNFITRAMGDDGDADMQKYFLKRLSELGSEMDCTLRNAINEGDARIQHTLLEAITNTTEQVKQSLLKAISEGDERVRDAAIADVHAAVEHVVESQILTHAPNLVSDAVATVIRTTTNFLRAKYKQDNTIRLLSHFPDSAIPIDTIFTTLNIVNQDQVVRPPQVLDTREDALTKYEEIYQIYQHASLEAVFSTENETVKKLLIQGRPGIGKSTLCRRIVREWSNGTLWPGRFHVIFLLPLGNITEADVSLDLPHIIHKYCLESTPVINVALLGQALRQRAEKMLIILDGFDEFTNHKHSPAVHRFIHGQLTDYNQCRVILTSRISCINNLRQTLSERDSFDQELEIVGFSEAASQRFIYSYFEAVEAPHMASKLIETLKANSVLRGIAHIPLHTTLLCMAWEEKKGIFPNTSTELVKSLIDDVLERNTRRLGAFKGDQAKTMQTVLVRMLMCLGQLAIHGFHNNALMFQASTVDEICKSRLPAELGFLHEDKVSSRRKGSKPVYYFLHLVFQEYLAAWYLVNSRSILSHFNPDPRYDMIWRFAAGIMGANAGSNEGSNAGPLIELIVQHAARSSNKRLFHVALDCLLESKFPETHMHLMKPVMTGIIDLRSSDLNATHFTQILQLCEKFPEATGLLASNTLVSVTTPIVVSSYQSYLSRNTSLTKLWLANNKINDDSLLLLTGALVSNSTLTELNLEGNEIGSAGIESLTAALRVNTSLTSLNLSRNPINEEGIRCLASFLKRPSSLAVLGLAGRPLTKSGPLQLVLAQVMSQALAQNTTLLELDLAWNSLGVDGAKALSIALSINKSLKVLNLDSNRLGADGASHVAFALKKNTGITTLSLNNNNIGVNGAQHIAKALLVNRSLTSLSLEANHIGVRGMNFLASGLAANPSLTSLSVSANGFGAQGAVYLGIALQSKTCAIQDLKLFGNEIGNDGLSHIVKSGCNLRTIDLAKNSIGAQGISYLCEAALSMLSLSEVRLDSNPLGIEGCRALGPLIASSKSLAVLSLSGCDIGDNGILAIQQAIERSKSPLNIDLSTNGLTKPGVLAVAVALKENSTIRSINLSWNNALLNENELEAFSSIANRIIGIHTNHSRIADFY